MFGKLSESLAGSLVATDGGFVLKGNPWLVLRSSFKAEAAPRPLAGNYVGRDWLIEVALCDQNFFRERESAVRSFVFLWQEKGRGECTIVKQLGWLQWSIIQLFFNYLTCGTKVLLETMQVKRVPWEDLDTICNWVISVLALARSRSMHQNLFR